MLLLGREATGLQSVHALYVANTPGVSKMAEHQGIAPWTPFLVQAFSKRFPRLCRSCSLLVGFFSEIGRAPRFRPGFLLVPNQAGPLSPSCPRCVKFWRKTEELHPMPQAGHVLVSTESRFACPDYLPCVLLKKVASVGLAPTTLRLKVGRSIWLSYRAVYVFENGSGAGSRTREAWLMRPAGTTRPSTAYGNLFTANGAGRRHPLPWGIMGCNLPALLIFTKNKHPYRTCDGAVPAGFLGGFFGVCRHTSLEAYR